MPNILILNGPNLNLLGHREPTLYGHTTLSDIITTLTTLCTSKDKNIQLSHLQSNHEGVLIDRIHAAKFPTAENDDVSKRADFIIINPGAFTHTSVALRDALLGVEIPFMEVHISNVHAREAFRHKSFLSDKAVAVICGLGTYGYEAGVEFAVRYLEGKAKGEKKA